MNRTLTITAAEWASVHDGTLWLVREASLSFTRVRGGSPVVMEGTYGPPAEFVQACAPCETCGGSREVKGMWHESPAEPLYPCPACGIELVGPWRLHQTREGDTFKPVTFGHAYAVGQPLPIYDHAGWEATALDVHALVVLPPGSVWLVPERQENSRPITDRLAHYGPPESLVGKWALELAMQP